MSKSKSTKSKPSNKKASSKAKSSKKPAPKKPQSKGQGKGKPGAKLNASNAAKKPELADAKARAALRKKNLKIIHEKSPELVHLVGNYQPISQLVVDEDGNPDVIFEGEAFYGEPLEDYVNNQFEKYWQSPTRYRLAPLQPQNFDSTAGPFIHNMLRRCTDEKMEFGFNHATDEGFFLIVLGFGLGAQIDMLLERTKCKAILIVEPNPEFFYHSLDFFDWTSFFEKIDKREITFGALVNSNPVSLSFMIRGWLRGSNPMSFDGTTYYIHYNNPILISAMKRLNQDKELILAGLGFFYDETLMVKHTHHNLWSGKERVYVRPENPRLDCPVFVIGNGPSLDNDMEFIRENQHRAIIVSSGSCLRPLLMGGVTPDFQMETENIGVHPLISQAAEKHDISKVCLVTSSTVDIDVPPYFDNVLYYFRSSLSPYPLFCDTESRCLKNPNPTVLNASLSFAQEMGFRNFYFFGTDLGTTMGAEQHHSKNAYHFTDDAPPDPWVYDIPVPGNFGGTCLASEGMLWTRDSIEKAIRDYPHGRFYFNCSNGTKIEDTLPMPSSLVELTDLPGGKQPIIDKIYEHFPVFDAKEFDEHWQDDKMQGHFNEWLDEFLKLVVDQPNFDNLSYLTNLMNHMLSSEDTRQKQGTSLMFRGTLMQAVMALEYYGRRLTDEKLRPKFEEIAKDEISKAVASLRQMAADEFGSLSKDAAKTIPRK